MTHNQLTLQANRIQQFNAYENNRHNVAVETETNRHQVKMEELEDFKNGVLNYEAIEQARHNRNLEDIQARNVNVEYYKAVENARHNKESERINAWLASTQDFLAHETAKHNRNIESIDRLKAVSDSDYKSAAASNQRAQAKKSSAEAEFLNDTMPYRVSNELWKSVRTFEDIILEPIKAAGTAGRGAGTFINLFK